MAGGYDSPVTLPMSTDRMFRLFSWTYHGTVDLLGHDSARGGKRLKNLSIRLEPNGWLARNALVDRNLNNREDTGAGTDYTVMIFFVRAKKKNKKIVVRTLDKKLLMGVTLVASGHCKVCWVRISGGAACRCRSM